MALQSSRLVMVGLGLRDDVPPVDEQPPLIDGVHLRWSSPRAVAFPWYGYFLYRRRSREKRLDGCLSRTLSSISLGSAGHLLSIGAGRLSSPEPLVFTDDFAPSGTPEIDLRNRNSIRFDRPASRPAHSFRIQIGFREDRGLTRCIDFGGLRAAALPLRIADITISARRAGTRVFLGRPPVDPAADRDGLPALALGGDTDLQLPEGLDWVEVEVSGTGKAFAISKLANADSEADRQRFAGTEGKREVVRLKSAKALRLHVADTNLWLHRVCFPVGVGRERSVLLEGLDQLPGTDPGSPAVVATAVAAGKPGDIVHVQLSADRMTGVRIAGGDAAVVDLCWSDVAQGATDGWEPLGDCPQPLTLPVRDLDYPAWQGNQDLALAESVGTGRVRYGPSTPWEGESFKEMHEQCVALVSGGPAAGPMDDPARATVGIGLSSAPPAGLKVPGLQSLHPLDILMLGSVHRPIAEILGLSWTDRTHQTEAPFDYLVAADHNGLSGGSAEKLLSQIVSAGFTNGIDGWICFGLGVAKRDPLAPPQDGRVYALPGGTVRPGGIDDPIEQVAGSAGLTWPSQLMPFGWLIPGAFVAHHLWRADAGNGQNPAVPPEAGEWLTKDRPVLSTLPKAAPTGGAVAPADWPSFPFDYVDFRLSEGWYGYQLSGVDILGRFSPKAPYAGWWQWAPEPTPRPWYYQGSSVAQEVHAAAVRILDKRRPPVPMGLEAFVLDPDDPLVVTDAAYLAWRAAHAGTIGLRVRWRWTAQQQVSAPGVTEFRLYWAGGTTPPSGWNDPEAWPTRFFVCAYGANVSVLGGERRYEVFLPAGPGTAFAGGVPLAPTLADPIAYANVSVTSADSVAHTADRWPGGGGLGGRRGNESGCAAPQKVFRVWRTKPLPPPPIVDSPRVYATPADWHGHSFHTFRWAPQPHLFAHVCRAIDEAVFETDWAQQPRAALDVADTAFPTAAEPIWTNAKKTQVAGQINAVTAGLLPAAPSPAQKAAAKPEAMARYRALPDDALRVLANRAGNDKAFVQVTINPFAQSAAPDRRGPDDAPSYAPQAGRSAYTDTVDGRAKNRLLYRALFVDGAQNRSGLGPCGTPVRLPDVTPPRAPSVGKAIGGDRAITLSWGSNREDDLLEYRIFRATSEADAADLRLMTQVAVLPADADPAARPAKVEWTDAGIPGRRDFFYRIVAVDRPDPVDPRGGGGNVSLPSPAMRARAFDDSVPVPPAIASLEWVRLDDAGTVFPFADPPPPGTYRLPAVRVIWAAADAEMRLMVQMKPASETGFRTASGWLAPGTTSFIHRTDHTYEPLTYRLKIVNGAGTANTAYDPAELATP